MLLKILNMIDNFFDKKSASLAGSETWVTQDISVSSGTIKNENMSNKELAEELHKPIIRKFKNRKVYSSFTDSTWGTDLADMQLISKFNKGFPFIHISWFIPLNVKKGIKITNAFQKILDESNCNPNKTGVEKCSEF